MTTSTEIAAAPAPAFDLTPKNFEQALQLADYLAASSMVPKDFIDKPGNCLIAVQWGAEVGLKPLQALQNIAVINGRPALWGDAMLALVRSSQVCEYVKESDDGKTATCWVKRRGNEEHVSTFSMDDAQKAGLAGKAGPWTQYPKRMRQMRARGFALRDVFPDVLKGMAVAEELMDFPKELGAADVIEWPEDLLEESRIEAAKGAAAYGKFWVQKVKPDLQAKLKDTDEHAQNKANALKADSARTVDSPAPSKKTTSEGKATQGSFANVMERLVKAKTLDELEDASEWIGDITDDIQRSELVAKFNLRAEEIGGAA